MANIRFPLPESLFPNGLSGFTDVQPFTRREGMSVLATLEAMRRYVNTVLAPHINKQGAELIKAWEAEVIKMRDSVNGAYKRDAIKFVQDAFGIIKVTVGTENPLIFELLSKSKLNAPLGIPTLNVRGQLYYNQVEPLTAYGYVQLPLLPPNQYYLKDFYFKGDSLNVADGGMGVGLDDTYGAILAKRFKARNYYNDHVGGSTTTDLVNRLTDSSSREFQSAANPHHVKEDDVCVINIGVNDLIMTGNIPNGDAYPGRVGYYNGMIGTLGILSSTTVITDGEETGAWADIEGPFSNNRMARVSRLAGAKKSFTFTVEAGKGVTLSMYAGTDGTGAAYRVKIDGVVLSSVPTTAGSGLGGQATQLRATYAPAIFTYKDKNWANGSKHVLEVEQLGDGPLIVNAVHVWGNAPTIRVGHVFEQTPEAFAIGRPEANFRANNALVTSFYQKTLTSLIAYFDNPKIQAVRTDLYTTLFSIYEPDLRWIDNMHPNVDGQKRFERIFYEAIVGLTPNAESLLPVRKNQVVEFIPDGSLPFSKLEGPITQARVTGLVSTLGELGTQVFELQEGSQALLDSIQQQLSEYEFQQFKDGEYKSFKDAVADQNRLLNISGATSPVGVVESTRAPQFYTKTTSPYGIWMNPTAGNNTNWIQLSN